MPKLCRIIFIICIIALTPTLSFAVEMREASTVAGRVQIIKSDKENKESGFALYGVYLNDRNIKNIEGYVPTITNIIEHKDMTVVMIKIDTGGNDPCMSGSDFAVAIYKDKTYKIINDLEITCKDEFTISNNIDNIVVSWRMNANTVRYLTTNKKTISMVDKATIKHFNNKDYEKMYYLYTNICDRAKYISKDIQNYKMNPGAANIDTYMYYSDFLEKGSFKSMCYERQIGKRKVPLKLDQFVANIRNPKHSKILPDNRQIKSKEQSKNAIISMSKNVKNDYCGVAKSELKNARTVMEVEYANYNKYPQSIPWDLHTLPQDRLSSEGVTIKLTGSTDQDYTITSTHIKCNYIYITKSGETCIYEQHKNNLRQIRRL